MRSTFETDENHWHVIWRQFTRSSTRRSPAEPHIDRAARLRPGRINCVNLTPNSNVSIVIHRLLIQRLALTGTTFSVHGAAQALRCQTFVVSSTFPCLPSELRGSLPFKAASLRQAGGTDEPPDAQSRRFQGYRNAGLPQNRASDEGGTVERRREVDGKPYCDTDGAARYRRDAAHALGTADSRTTVDVVQSAGDRVRLPRHGERRPARRAASGTRRPRVSRLSAERARIR